MPTPQTKAMPTRMREVIVVSLAPYQVLKSAPRNAECKMQNADDVRFREFSAYAF
jgi:hypothetical protein